MIIWDPLSKYFCHFTHFFRTRYVLCHKKYVPLSLFIKVGCNKAIIDNYIQVLLLKTDAPKKKKLNYFLEPKILYYFILTIKCIISYVNKLQKKKKKKITKINDLVNHQSLNTLR